MNAYGNPRAAPASFRRWPGCLLDRARPLSIVIGRSLRAPDAAFPMSIGFDSQSLILMFPIDIDFVLVLEEIIFEKRWIIDFFKETMHFINCKDC